MSVKISIEPMGGHKFRVIVQDARSRTVHEVSVTPEHLKRYGHGATAEQLLEASFRFLLEREPKESILPRFELSLIETYFSDYSAKIRALL
jgi:hypothetical protein